LAETAVSVVLEPDPIVGCPAVKLEMLGSAVGPNEHRHNPAKTASKTQRADRSISTIFPSWFPTNLKT
jgi:hypothetical protein